MTLFINRDFRFVRTRIEEEEFNSCTSIKQLENESAAKRPV